MFGKMKLVPFEEMIIKDGEMKQKVASAWSALATQTGAKYTPLLYCAEQTVKGINHWFVVGVTRMTNPISRAVITAAVNEFEGKFVPVHGSDMTIFE